MTAMDFDTALAVLKYNEDQARDARGRFAGGGAAPEGGGRPSAGRIDTSAAAAGLKGAEGDRAAFDAALDSLSGHRAADVTAIAASYLGFKPVERTKAGLITAMRRWQRQVELNADRSRAQAKVPT